MSNQNKQLETKLQPLVGQRQSGESDNAVVACNDWLRMGTGRTLGKLLAKYAETYQYNPPTQSMATLKEWSRKFGWAIRSQSFDADYETFKNAERAAVMNFGTALDFERVRELKRLAALLEAQIYELSSPDAEGFQTLHNVWLQDVKQIGSGDFAERVDIERFNSAMISEYRAVLDDIAKEVGDRAKKTEVTGKDGGKMQHEVTRTVSAEDLTDDELASLLAGLNASSGK